jgi:dipeptidyl aminopeptidase/acylaminoacyl peptidase
MTKVVLLKTVLALALALALALTSPALAADGELLAQEPVPLGGDDLLDGVEGERKKRLQSMLEQTDRDIELSRITYESDGLTVRGYLAVPKAVKEGEKLPCVIYNRGGNREFGALDDLRAALFLGPLAERGYVVVASQYRGNGGGEGREEFGGADVRDVLNLIPLLERLERADASRIGMFGWSRGGMMTYQVLARTDRIGAAVIGAGVADSFETVIHRPEMETGVFAELVPDWADKREEALEARSAVRWPEKLHRQPPILILHGTGDWRVNPKQALRMAEALFEASHPFRLMIFEGGDHGLSEFRDEVDEAVSEWLNRYVRDGESWPSLKPHGKCGNPGPGRTPRTLETPQRR